LIALDACGPPLTRHDLCHASPFNAIGMVDACHGLQQSPALILGDSLEHTPVGSDRLEQLDGISKARRKRLRWSLGCGHQLRVTQSAPPRRVAIGPATLGHLRSDEKERAGPSARPTDYQLPATS
jgi:hypothetical protein